MANMIAAFFEKNSEKSLFEELAIAQYDQYKEQAGKLRMFHRYFRKIEILRLRFFVVKMLGINA